MTRQEYQRRWIACKRAKVAGLNIELADAFLGVAAAFGYEKQTARAALYLAAREGLLGTLQR